MNIDYSDSNLNLIKKDIFKNNSSSLSHSSENDINSRTNMSPSINSQLELNNSISLDQEINKQYKKKKAYVSYKIGNLSSNFK